LPEGAIAQTRRHLLLEPAKGVHFTSAKDGEVVIQVTGMGLTGKTFVDAK
jgi:hypothetical protein